MDVGAWLQGHRATQAVADASALAGAQALPADTSTATSVALDYSTKNGGGVAGGDIQFASNTFPNDTIQVQGAAHRHRLPLPRARHLVRQPHGGCGGARVQPRRRDVRCAVRHRQERAVPLGPAAPVTTCRRASTSSKVGPGGFEIINIDGSRGGIGPQTLASWILDGLNQSMPLGWYFSDPGAKFNSSNVKNAMNSRIGTVLLFPVYDAIQGNGSNLQYRVVGWAGFHMTGWNAQGNNATISGYLKHVAWEGRPSTSATNYFGAVVVKLTA